MFCWLNTLTGALTGNCRVATPNTANPSSKPRSAKCAIREVREETGLEVLAERTSGIYFDAQEDFHHFVFVCKAMDSSLIFVANDGITECAYWPSDGLPRPISDFTVRRIQDAIKIPDVTLPVIFSGRKWLE